MLCMISMVFRLSKCNKYTLWHGFFFSWWSTRSSTSFSSFQCGDWILLCRTNNISSIVAVGCTISSQNDIECANQMYIYLNGRRKIFFVISEQIIVSDFQLVCCYLLLLWQLYVAAAVVLHFCWPTDIVIAFLATILVRRRWLSLKF